MSDNTDPQADTAEFNTALMEEAIKEVETESSPGTAVSDTPPQLIRSKNNGSYTLVKSKAWGSYLDKCEDPEGIEITAEMLETLLVNEDFPKIPKDLWSRIISLYFELCEPGNKTADQTSEVSVVFLRSDTPEDTASGYRTWKVLVPLQKVGHGSVSAKFDKCVDIVSGEEELNFPPQGWVHSGSSHSHNTMGAFFSSTDDKNELGVPGLHIVVGCIDIKDKTYEAKASIVLKGKRYIVDPDLVIETDPDEKPFHANVRNYISREGYYAGSAYSSASSSAVPTSTDTPNKPSAGTTTYTPKSTVHHKDSSKGFFNLSTKEEKLDVSSRRKIRAIRGLLAECYKKEEMKDMVIEICKHYYIEYGDVSSYYGHGWE